MYPSIQVLGVPQWLSGKESACSAGAAGDSGSIPGLRRSLGGGPGNTLQYSCLENRVHRGAWRATVHRGAELDRTEATCTLTCTHTLYIKYFSECLMEKEIECKDSYNLPEVKSFRARFEFCSSSPAPALNYSTISPFYPENF